MAGPTTTASLAPLQTTNEGKAANANFLREHLNGRLVDRFDDGIVDISCREVELAG